MKGKIQRLTALFLASFLATLLFAFALPHDQKLSAQTGEPFEAQVSIAVWQDLADLRSLWPDHAFNEYGIRVLLKDKTVMTRDLLFDLDIDGEYRLTDPDPVRVPPEQGSVSLRPLKLMGYDLVPGWDAAQRGRIVSADNVTGDFVLATDRGEVWQNDTLGALAKVDLPAKAFFVASFGRVSGAVTEDGRVFIWHLRAELLAPDASGRPDYYRSGTYPDPSESEAEAPRQIEGISGAIELAISKSAAVALTKDGNVYVWTRRIKPVLAFSNAYVPQTAKTASADRATCILNAVKWKGLTNSLQTRHDLIKGLLDEMQKQGVSNLQAQAYILATGDWETGGFSSLVEDGKEAVLNQKYGPNTLTGRHLENTQPTDGYRYRGRGIVHVTGRGHYTKFSEDFDQDFVNNPDLMADPSIAVKIAVSGMKNGDFTTEKLSDFFGDGVVPDYLGARRIINGDPDEPFKTRDGKVTTQIRFIANQAKQIEVALKRCMK
jgi:predicted chitinase